MSPKLILVANAGSSSLKLALFVLREPRHDWNLHEEPVSLLSSASVSSIGTSTAKFSYSLILPSLPKRRTDLPSSATDHASFFEYYLRTLFSDEDFVSSGYGRDQVTYVCHRVVHGGNMSGPVIVGKEAYTHLEALSELAPLHNRAALSIIEYCHHALPHASSLAFFDSTFHQTLPPHIYTYPISPSVAKEKFLRKYGFHGLSYAYILRCVAAHLNKAVSDTSLVALHLGSGASVCAIRNGESVNVSMGLTPLAGLPGGTRSGDVDPSLIFHYTQDVSDTKSIHITEAEKILNMQAGWKALTGTTDFHEIATSREPSHKLAFDIFVDRVCQFIGGYFVQLEGQLDALVFSGGIGENSLELRREVIQRCACLGFDAISEMKHSGMIPGDGVVYDIGQGLRQTRVLVCKTNEEIEIARQCALNSEYWNSP